MADTEMQPPFAEAEASLTERVARLEGKVDGANALLEERQTTFAQSTTNDIGREFDRVRGAFKTMLDERDRRNFGETQNGDRALTFPEVLEAILDQHDRRRFGETDDGKRALTFAEAYQRETSSRRTRLWERTRKWGWPAGFAIMGILTMLGGGSVVDGFGLILRGFG